MIEADRLIAPKETREDELIDRAIRPKQLMDYQGQDIGMNYPGAINPVAPGVAGSSDATQNELLSYFGKYSSDGMNVPAQTLEANDPDLYEILVDAGVITSSTQYIPIATLVSYITNSGDLSAIGGASILNGVETKSVQYPPIDVPTQMEYLAMTPQVLIIGDHQYPIPSSGLNMATLLQDASILFPDRAQRINFERVLASTAGSDGILSVSELKRLKQIAGVSMSVI